MENRLVLVGNQKKYYLLTRAPVYIGISDSTHILNGSCFEGFQICVLLCPLFSFGSLIIGNQCDKGLQIGEGGS